jgi:hypothetical protein
MAYCSADEVLARMGHPAATSADLLARIVDAIPSAQAQIDSDTGRPSGFEPSTATRTFRSLGYGDVLTLPDFTAITTLKVDDDDDGVFETTIAASGYELGRMSDRVAWPYDSITLLDRNWPYGGRRQYRVEIAGTWGWAAVPSPINQACSLMAARLAQRSKHALFGTESLGDVGAAMIRNNDPDYLRLIGPYRVPQVA